MPNGPRLADHEFWLMLDTVIRFEEGEISAARASAIAAALSLLRLTLRSDGTEQHRTD
jgi:hypothetical protein